MPCIAPRLHFFEKSFVASCLFSVHLLLVLVDRFIQYLRVECYFFSPFFTVINFGDIMLCLSMNFVFQNYLDLILFQFCCISYIIIGTFRPVVLVVVVELFVISLAFGLDELMQFFFCRLFVVLCLFQGP